MWHRATQTGCTRQLLDARLIRQGAVASVSAVRTTFRLHVCLSFSQISWWQWNLQVVCVDEDQNPRDGEQAVQRQQPQQCLPHFPIPWQ